MLAMTTKKRVKALIHFLASTAGRVGIFDHNLRMQHLTDMSSGCKAVLLYAGDKEEYWAFLTPEAYLFLMLTMRNGRKMVKCSQMIPDFPNDLYSRSSKGKIVEFTISKNDHI